MDISDSNIDNRKNVRAALGRDHLTEDRNLYKIEFSNAKRILLKNVHVYI